MKKIKIFFLILLLSFTISLFLTSSTVAQTPQRVPGPCSDINNDLGACIVQIYTWSLGLGVLFALLIIVIAGYLYVTSQGNANTVAKAKELFTGAIIGLIILFAAVIILRTINPELVRFPPLNLRRTEIPPSTGGGVQTVCLSPDSCTPPCAATETCQAAFGTGVADMRCVSECQRMRVECLVPSACTPSCSNNQVCRIQYIGSNITMSCVTPSQSACGFTLTPTSTQPTSGCVNFCSPLQQTGCPSGRRCVVVDTSVCSSGFRCVSN